VTSDRLSRLLGRQELEWLVTAARRRLEYGGGDRLTVSGLSSEQRAAAEGLLGRRPGRGDSLSLSLGEVEAVLQQAGAAADLRSALERLGGPLLDRQAEQAALRQRWDDVWQRAGAQAGERLMPWLEGLKGSGLLRRLSGRDPDVATRLLGEALLVITRLPGGGQTLSTLAATAVGDAHALDPGRPLTTLVKKAALYLGDQDEAEGQEEGDRALWAAVGILPGGAITSTVLVVNLDVRGAGATAAALRRLGEEGQPVWLSLRQLLRDAPHWHCRGQTVYVCENPAVVAEAADALGPRCRPLVCTNGQPVAAVTTLLRQLGAAGAALCYHGDFDWPGIVIGNRIIGKLGARPWRFDAHGYRQAAETLSCQPLSGRPVIPAWDPRLGEAMAALDLQVHEEQVLSGLLEDLTGS
jgi:uncharacterized protein (TIGR02679 family)